MVNRVPGYEVNDKSLPSVGSAIFLFSRISCGPRPVSLGELKLFILLPVLA